MQAIDTHAPPAAEPSLMEELRALPRWIYAVAGGIVAAGMGALLGGAMHL